MIDFPANPTNGMVYSNYIYDSSITAWRNVNTDTGIGTLNAMGLKNIVPTSVDVSSGSATTNANGTVTFSGATSISLNNIFSSTYTNYQFNFVLNEASVADADINGRLRVSGTDSSASYYVGGVMEAAGSLSAINNLNINYWQMGRTHSGVNPLTHAAISFKVFQPIGTKPTTYFTESISWTNSATNAMRFGGFNTALTSYTGFTLFAGSGTFGGTLSVYGYTN